MFQVKKEGSKQNLVQLHRRRWQSKVRKNLIVGAQC